MAATLGEAWRVGRRIGMSIRLRQVDGLKPGRQPVPPRQTLAESVASIGYDAPRFRVRTIVRITFYMLHLLRRSARELINGVFLTPENSGEYSGKQ
jgi:hypothetical protein